MQAEQEFAFKVETAGKLTEFDKDISFVTFEFKLTQLNAKVEIRNVQQHILIVVDKSGSMSGAPINASKEGIIEMVKFFNTNGFRNVSLIRYDSNAVLTEFSDMEIDKQIASVQSINANGGTSFSAAFQKIIESVKVKGSKDIKVIFFTDGEDGGAKAALVTLEKFFADYPNSEFHTIGFRQNHDVDLLNKIAKVGGKQGTFQYCKSIESIKECVESVTGLVGIGSVNAQIILDKDEIPLELQDNNTEEVTDELIKNYKSTLFVAKNKFKDSFIVKFYTGNSLKYVEIPVSSLSINQADTSSPTYMKLIYVKSEIARYLQQALNLRKDNTFNKELCAQIFKQVEQKDKILDQLNFEAAKLKGKEKRDFYPQLFEVKQLVAEFYSKLKDLQSGQINNDKVASLNALAYRKITKKGLQKKLDVRTQNNIGVINNVYDKVKEYSSKLDFSALEQKYKQLSVKLGTCVYSANTFLEALKDQDCLCLTYDVSRSQAAIMDPSQIKIKDVFPTYISVASFLFSAEYALKNNKEAHGGFQKGAQGSILKGVARQDITGVLPLYICEENWPIAKQLMKPALGWTVTLDPLGYAFSQVKTVPFLVLSRLYRSNYEQKSEHTDFQIQLVQETCIQIIKDASGAQSDVKLVDEILKPFNEYMVNPLARTIDSIASNQVFLVQLHLLTKMKLLEMPVGDKLTQFLDAVWEEQMRRQSDGFKEDVKVSDKIFALLNINTKKYVDQPFQQFVESMNAKKEGQKPESQYATRFLQRLELNGYQQKKQIMSEEKKQQKAQEKPNSKPKLGEIVYEIELRKDDKYNQAQLQAIAELQNYRKRSLSVTLLRYLFGSQVPNQPFELKPQNENFYLCLYLQNKLNAKNSDRRDSITNKNYLNPFTEAAEYIRKYYVKFAEQEKNRKVTEYTNQLIGNQASLLGNTFAQSKDINEAAGCLLGAYIGRDVNYFHKALCLGGAPLFEAKLEMLVTGKCKGVYLYGDKFAVNNYEGWKICKHKANQVFRTNHTQMTQERWHQLIPNLSKTYISLKFKGLVN